MMCSCIHRFTSPTHMHRPHASIYPHFFSSLLIMRPPCERTIRASRGRRAPSSRGRLARPSADAHPCHLRTWRSPPRTCLVEEAHTAPPDGTARGAQTVVGCDAAAALWDLGVAQEAASRSDSIVWVVSQRPWRLTTPSDADVGSGTPSRPCDGA